MKKFIKFIIIFLLVCVAVITTVAIFFKKVKENEESKVSVLAFATSEARQTFNEKLKYVSDAVVAADAADSRFDVLKRAVAKLDSSLDVLATYYIENSGNIKNGDIASAMDDVNSTRSLAISMANEFKIKSSSIYYNKHLGANDFLKTTSNYVVNYAKLLMLLNNNIDIIDKNADVKFSMIDVYCRICIEDFSTLEEATNNWVKCGNTENFNFIEPKFKFVNAQLVTKEIFSVDNTKFVNAYNNCNKDEFAKKLKANCNNLPSENLTNEQTATFYFKKVYGI